MVDLKHLKHLKGSDNLIPLRVKYLQLNRILIAKIPHALQIKLFWQIIFLYNLFQYKKRLIDPKINHLVNV